MDATSREIECLGSSVSSASEDERQILQDRQAETLLDRSRMSSNGAEDRASAIEETTEAFDLASEQRDSQHHNVLPDIALHLMSILILQSSPYEVQQSLPWRPPPERFETTGDVKDIDIEISRLKAQIKSENSHQSQRCSDLANLSNTLLHRCKRFGGPQYVDDAIDAAKTALDMMPQNSSDRTWAIENLCDALLHRGSNLGRGYEMADIEFPIQCVTNALQSGIEDPEEEMTLWKCHGILRFAKFDVTRDVSNIKDSISAFQKLVDLARKSGSDVGEALNLLSGSLRELFLGTGDESDLDDAISGAREFLNTLNPHNPHYDSAIQSLADLLQFRYTHTRNTTHLNEAIDLAQMGKKRLPADHPTQHSLSLLLSSLLIERCHRRNDPADIDEAINQQKRTMDALPGDPRMETIRHDQLATCYRTRYRFTRRDSDINTAVDQAKKAVEASRGMPFQKQATYLLSYAQTLNSRCSRLSDPRDIEESLSSAAEALQILPDEHIYVGMARSALADGLLLKFRVEHDHTYMDEAIKNLVIAANHQTGSAKGRIEYMRKAILLLCVHKDFTQANKLAGSAIDLLPRLCSRRMNRDDQQHAIQEASGLAADGCSLALRAGDVSEALRRIEFGRGLILGYLIDGRNDLKELRERAPDLAKQYETLRSKAFVENSGSEDAARHLEGWEEKIRQEVPGFENFLRPPPVDEMTNAAADGPIIIVNVTDISADAIIVRSTGSLEQLPLPAMNRKLSMPHQTLWATADGTLRHSEKLRDAEPEATPHSLVESLPELWKACVLPILEHLGLKPPQDQKSSSESGILRTWWIGTGHASGLPFHAAGDSGSNTVNATCLDWTVPSYTPSIKALQYARERAVRGRELGANEERSVLVATMPSTPGKSALPGVQEESRAIEKAVEGTYKVTTRESPTVPQILDDMQQAGIVHFACHGLSDPTNPLGSHLLLQRTGDSGVEVDKLTIESLISAKAQTRAWVAYLSACATAQTRVPDLRDENLHITSAFEVAGFAHVIGSMWSVDDSVSIEVARLFYEYLSKHRDTAMTDRVIAEALRHATLAIREMYPNDPTVWAPYLHYGA